MRTKNRDTFSFVIYSQLDADGNAKNSQASEVYNTSGRLSRSDVQRVTMDTTGWRNPTTYQVDDLLVSRQWGTRSLYLDNQNPSVIGGQSTEYWEGPCDWIPELSPTTFEEPSFPDDLRQVLTNRNLLKLRDQKINLALNMAELSKTASGVAQTALKLKTSLSAFRRGDFKRSLSSLGLSTRRKGKDASSTWLELQYGILPLMGDIHGGYEELTRKTRQHGQRTKVVSRWSQKGSAKQSGLPIAYMPQNSRGFTGSVDFKTELSAQLILWYEVDNPTLLAASSVGLTNPAEIVWELTPWSFVVDWFLPIGDYLGALTAAQGFKFLGGSYTTNFNRLNRMWLEPMKPFRHWTDPWILVTPSCSGERIVTQKSMRRQAISAYYPPRAYLPSFKSPLSVGHALNALALLRSIK